MIGPHSRPTALETLGVGPASCLVPALLFASLCVWSASHLKGGSMLGASGRTDGAAGVYTCLSSHCLRAFHLSDCPSPAKRRT